MVIGPADKDLSWIKEAYDNLLKLGITPKALPTPEAIRAHFSERGLADAVGNFANKTGYYNPVAGWSEATRAVKIGHRRVQKLGGTIEGGKEVAGFVADGKKVTGVRLIGGEVIEADHVIVATGAWCVQKAVAQESSSRRLTYSCSARLSLAQDAFPISLAGASLLVASDRIWPVGRQMGPDRRRACRPRPDARHLGTSLLFCCSVLRHNADDRSPYRTLRVSSRQLCLFEPLFEPFHECLLTLHLP